MIDNVNNKIVIKNYPNIKDNNVSNKQYIINFNNIKYKNKNIKSILESIINLNKELSFNFNELLGQGGFGLVFSIKYKKKTDLALKIFIANEKQDLKYFYMKTNNEINLMRNLLHFNIVRSFYKIKDDGKFLGVLMEECKFKTLSMFVNKMFKEFNFNLNNNKFFYLSYISETMIKFFVIQILNGLKFFQTHNIIHGDFKMENLLLSNYFTIKITDFSTVLIINKKNEVVNNSKVSNENNTISNSNLSTTNISNDINKKTKKILKPSTCTCMGNEYYENDLNIDNDNKDLFKVDLFGLGTIIYKMMYKKNFIPNTDKENYKIENFKKWQNDAIINLENDSIYSKELREIVKGLISDIKDRTSLNDLLKNNYIFPKNKRLNYEIEKTLNINRCDSNKLFVELNKLQHIVNIINIKSKKIENKQFLHKKKFNVKILNKLY